MLRSLYDWVIRLAGHPRAIPAIGVVSFAESSFFPIPPDVMLVPMVLANRHKAFTIALVCTVCSVLGGLLGYAIGYYFFETIGDWVVKTYGLQSGLAKFRAGFEQYGIWVILIKGLTPIPYKLVTIASGAAHFDLFTFVWASIVTRGVRFFARGSVAVEIRRADPRLHREAADAGHVAVPDRAGRRLRRCAATCSSDVHGPVATHTAAQPARPARRAGQRRAAGRRLLLPVRRRPGALRPVPTWQR